MSVGYLLPPLRKIRQKRWTCAVLGFFVCVGLFRFYSIINPWLVDNVHIRWRHSGAYETLVPWTQAGSRTPKLNVYIVEEHHEVIPFWVDIVKRYGGRKATLVHIDAHSDLDYPELVPNFPLGRLPQNDMEVSAMMQANDQFIQSAVIAQLINTTYVIYPPWVANETDAYEASLGMTMQNGRWQICLCFHDQSPSCQTRDWKSGLNTSQIKREECERKWAHNHLEIESETAPGIIRLSEQWSISSDNLSPLILDIDEDYFGVHLPARNLTDTMLNISRVKAIDEVIQNVFCPESPEMEPVIDRWFFELTERARNRCFEKPSGSSQGQRLTHCSQDLFQFIYDGLVKYSSLWLCEVDLHEATNQLASLFASSDLNPEQLYVLGRTGLCLTMAWSTHLYEPHMRLCVGHNLPGSSLVEEHIPNEDEVFALAANMSRILVALPRAPDVITICRSTRDGYTPRWLQPFIETVVLGLVKRVFNVTEEFVHYSPRLAGGWSGWEHRLREQMLPK